MYRRNTDSVYFFRKIYNVNVDFEIFLKKFKIAVTVLVEEIISRNENL